MNRGADSILSVYSDARAEYTKQLCVYLVPAYFQFFIDLLEKSKQTVVNEPKKSLWQFQTYLNEIHDWNMEKVNNEIHIINKNCGCDYLEDLLTAVFIAHTKVLTAIRLSSNNKKVEITVPKVEHFLFKVLCETSKLLWGSTYLFRDGISGIEKQQNYRTIENILNEGILLAIRNLVPVKSILKSFVNNDSDDVKNTGDMNNAHDTKADDDSDDDTEKDGPAESVDVTISKSQSDSESASVPPPPAPTPTPAPTPASVVASIVAPLLSSFTSEPLQNEKSDLEDTLKPGQTIVIEDKPTVSFGEFNAMFDSDNPDKSDMIKDVEDEEDPVLEIMDDVGTSLSSGVDFINLDEDEKDSTGDPEQMGSDDYEEL
jgi:hypothetical protein